MLKAHECSRVCCGYRMALMSKSKRERVALETTLLVHGVPRDAALPLFDELCQIVEREGAEPVLVGLIGGRSLPGLKRADLEGLLSSGKAIPKANTANLGPLIAQGASAATTVSATMEIASGAGIRMFATGGLGGVHKGLGVRLDISSDLAALARFPVAVVSSGVKSILDVAGSREALESLGVPVVGFRTDEFPAFYLRCDPTGSIGVDARFDDVGELATFVDLELERRGRGIVIVNPIPAESELDRSAFAGWLAEAEAEVRSSGARGRDVTPALLQRLHQLSGGATLEANLALVRSNASLAARVAAHLEPRD